MAYVSISHMRRTTIYLEPELEVLLKLEMQRTKRPMADIVREAIRALVTREPRTLPPGAGAFASGHADTADRAEDILRDTGFGDPDAPSPSPARSRRTAGRRSRARTATRTRSR